MLDSEGSMRVTVNEIAERCGVSRTTVLRALNNQARVGEATKKRILEVAKELNYRPNLVARSLNKGRTMMIGMVAINMENMVFVESLSEVNKEAQRLGYSLNIALNGENQEAEIQRIREFADRQMEGILLSAVNQGPEFEDFLASLNIPIVCVGNYVSDAYSTIMIDEAQAARDAVNLILSKGYKRIVFVCPPLGSADGKNIYSHLQRNAGFIDELGRRPGIGHCVIKGDDYIDQLKPLLSSLEERTAILCSGDIYALNIMRFFKENKIRTPRDVGIMGFDNIGMLDFIVPRLTTVSTNIEKVAKTAVDELVSHITDPTAAAKKIVLPHQILDMETL